MAVLDPSLATTYFPPNAWGKALWLCASHAETNRQGHTFPVYQLEDQ